MAAPQGHRFLIGGGRARASQKSLGVVNDVAFLARALNRVLVEHGPPPGALVDQFGEAQTIWPRRGGSGLGLANYWDVRP